MSEVVRQLVPKKRCCKAETSPPKVDFLTFGTTRRFVVISSSSLVGTIVQNTQVQDCAHI